MKLLRRACHVVSILTLLLCVASCALAQADYPGTNAPDERAGTSADQKRSDRNNPKADTPFEQLNTNADREQSKSENTTDDPPSKSGDWIAISAVIQAVSAVAVALFTGLLLWFNWGLWAETRKSADAAVSSANTARDALVAVQRAFVAKEGIYIRFGAYTQLDGSSTRMMAIEVTFPNSGSTPAIDVIGRLDVARSATEPTDEMILGKPPANYSVGYIAPKRVYQFSVDKTELEVLGLRAPSNKQKQTIITHQLTEGVYVFGWIAYRDIFNTPHVVQYCTVLQKLVINPDNGDMTWMNGVDEDCRNYAAIVARLPPRQTHQQQHSTQSQEPHP